MYIHTYIYIHIMYVCMMDVCMYVCVCMYACIEQQHLRDEVGAWQNNTK